MIPLVRLVISNIVYAPIDPDSRNILTGWSSGGSLPGARSGLVASSVGAPGNGTVIVTSGLYSGALTGSGEEEFVTLTSTGTVSGISSGSASINGAGGGNIFNASSEGYRDGGAELARLGGGRRRRQLPRHEARADLLVLGGRRPARARALRGADRVGAKSSSIIP